MQRKAGSEILNSSGDSDSEVLVEKALERWGDLSEPHRTVVREYLKSLLDSRGPQKFMLLEGLRKPKNLREQNLVDFYLESDENRRIDVIRQFAERPVDADMLQEYHLHVEHKLEAIGSFLQAVFSWAGECEKYDDPRAGGSYEREACDAFVRLKQKSEMYTSEMVTCAEFLADMNSRQGQGVIELENIFANSWHELTMRLMSFIIEQWNDCLEISNKSRTYDEYDYEAAASTLFLKCNDGRLPRPQQVYARISDEYRRAKLELRSSQADPNDELNHIEILEPINSGLYGRVYKGIQKNLDRIVAIKIIKESGKRTADVIAHAKLLTRTQHQALVTVHAVQLVYIPDLSKRVPSIVMEWLEGQAFADRLSKGEFSVEQAIMLSQDVIDGIAELHRVGLCHGDLHVGNVIVLNNGRGKIIDIDANKETSLSRMSLQSREAATQSDIDYCRGIIFKTLRRSTIPLSRLDDLEGELTRATTLDALRTVTNLFGQAGS